MGTVWRADDVLLGRAVAVKEVAFPPGTGPQEAEVLRERTRREARAAARLDHPSAVTVFDVVEEDGRPWLVLELVEARSLSEVIREDGPLSPARTAEVGLALLGALGAAHAEGIVHRDVKPGNVLLRDDGRVVLTDFGIATTTGDSSLTGSGLLVGSPAYMAPERVRGETPGPASDLWSLGATLYAAVEGRPPFDNEDPMQTVMAVATGEPAPAPAAGPLGPVLAGLLTKDPAQRWDAGRTRAALQDVAAHGSRAVTAPLRRPADPPTAALRVGDVGRAAATAAPAAAAPTRAAPTRAADVPARPAPPGRRVPAPVGRRVPPAAAAAVGTVLVLLAVGTGLLLTSGGADRTAAPAGTPAPTASPSASPAVSPTASPAAAPASSAPAAPVPSTPAPPAAAPPAATSAPAGSGPAPVPAGWQTFTDGPGWTVAVPPGWSAGTFDGVPQYRDPATGRTLRVETGTGQPDAVADRERAAESFARRHPTYREISIAAADYRGYPAADWEFTYEGLRVFDRVFVVDGRGYSLLFQTPQADYPRAQDDLQAILATFRPAGG